MPFPNSIPSSDSQISFRDDLMPYRKAVAEVIKLAQTVPNGLDLLRQFNDSGAERTLFIKRGAKGNVILEARPSAALEGLISDLRKRAGGAA